MEAKKMRAARPYGDAVERVNGNVRSAFKSGIRDLQEAYMSRNADRTEIASSIWGLYAQLVALQGGSKDSSPQELQNDAIRAGDWYIRAAIGAAADSNTLSAFNMLGRADASFQTAYRTITEANERSLKQKAWLKATISTIERAMARIKRIQHGPDNAGALSLAMVNVIEYPYPEELDSGSNGE